jgi:branched-chain amino acid transport system permease protein
MLSQFIANGICSGSLFAIIALGFGLIYNSTNIFHFAHGAVYVSAAYLFYLFFLVLNIPFITSLFITLIFTILFGLIIETLIYRPFIRKNFSHNALMISSFGVYLITVNTIALLAGNETKILLSGIDITYNFSLFGDIILTRIQIISFLTFLVVSILFFIFKKSKIGRVILAYSNNPVLTEILGYNPNFIRVFIFSVGSVLAGIASILFALDIGMDPNVGMNALLVSAVAVIIGGVKIFEGALLGGIIIGLIQSLVVWQISSRWMEASTFLLLIIFLLFRPQGLLGQKSRIEEIQ